MVGSYIKYTTTSTDGKLKYGSGKLIHATITFIIRKYLKTNVNAAI